MIFSYVCYTSISKLEANNKTSIASFQMLGIFCKDFFLDREKEGFSNGLCNQSSEFSLEVSSKIAKLIHYLFPGYACKQ